MLSLSSLSLQIAYPEQGYLTINNAWHLSEAYLASRPPSRVDWSDLGSSFVRKWCTWDGLFEVVMQYIFMEALRSRDWQHVELFDVEIVHAICHSNALDHPNTTPSKIHERPWRGWVPVRPRQNKSREGFLCNSQPLLSQYLYTKTKTNANDCPPAKLISDMVKYILNKRLPDKSYKDQPTRKLCEAAVAYTITITSII